MCLSISAEDTKIGQVIFRYWPIDQCWKIMVSHFLLCVCVRPCVCANNQNHKVETAQQCHKRCTGTPQTLSKELLHVTNMTLIARRATLYTYVSEMKYPRFWDTVRVRAATHTKARMGGKIRRWIILLCFPCFSCAGRSLYCIFLGFP